MLLVFVVIKKILIEVNILNKNLASFGCDKQLFIVVKRSIFLGLWKLPVRVDSVERVKSRDAESGSFNVAVWRQHLVIGSITNDV